MIVIVGSSIMIISFIVIVSTFLNSHHPHPHPHGDGDDTNDDDLDPKLLFPLPALLLTVAPHLVSKPSQRHICPLQRSMMIWQKRADRA